jgi:hypothetical protein
MARTLDRPFPTIGGHRPDVERWPAALYVGIERQPTASYVYDDLTAFYDDPEGDYTYDDLQAWPYERDDLFCKFHGLTITSGSPDTDGRFDSAHVEMTLDNRDGSLSQYDAAGRLVEFFPGRALDIWASLGDAVPGYLTPTVGTVATVQPADDPAGQTRVTADPTDAATYWRQADPATVTVGVNSGGTPYPGQLRSSQYEAINRAQLVFPGVAQNYLSVPSQAALDITGAVEIIVRMSQANWDANPAASWYLVVKDSAYNVARSSSGQYLCQYNEPSGTLRDIRITRTASIPNGTLTWLRFQIRPDNGAGGRSFTLDYSTEQGTAVPTMWTPMGTPTTQAGAGTIRTMATELAIGSNFLINPIPAGSRIARVIVRNGIAGPAVLDVSENNAGAMTGTTFTATTGQTVTVNQTAGNTIVQPQPDTVVWRFDANDYPGTGTSYVDPRGRTWTQTIEGAITPRVQPDAYWLFSGEITAWRERADDTVEAEAFDAFTRLNQPLSPQWDPGNYGDTPAQRLTKICTTMGYSGPTRFELGDVTLHSFVTNATPLEEMQHVAVSDGGILAVDADGTLTYRDRLWLLGRADQMFIDSFTDNYCKSPYNKVVWESAMTTDDEFIVNAATLTNVAALTVNALNSPSRGLYGPHQVTRTGDQWITTGQGQELADYLVYRRGDAYLRLEQFQLHLPDPNQDLWRAGIDRRLGDIVQWVHEQPGEIEGEGELWGGGLLVLRLAVAQIVHDITPDTWVTTFATSRTVGSTVAPRYDQTVYRYDEPGVTYVL